MLDFAVTQSEHHFRPQRNQRAGLAPRLIVVGADGGGSSMPLLTYAKEATMPKLNDTQRVLLSQAAQQPNASLYPLPASITETGTHLARAITTLSKLGLTEERETADTSAVHRTDGDARYGLFITRAGLAAIGVTTNGESGPALAATGPAPAPVSKSATVIALLSRDAGATTPELIAATGWLPHTMRAALTGLRKKGHVIERTKRDDATCYRISAAA